MSERRPGEVRMEDAPEGVLPRCPACSKDLPTLWIRKQGLGIHEQKQVVMCPHCRVMLGYGSTKLFN